MFFPRIILCKKAGSWYNISICYEASRGHRLNSENLIAPLMLVFISAPLPPRARVIAQAP